MKLILASTIALTIFCSFGHSSEPIEEFQVREGQSVSEVFEDLMAAHKGEESVQILITPELSGKELKAIKLRNLAIDRCVQFICERNNLSYIQKGNLYVITGGREAIATFQEQVDDNSLPEKGTPVQSKVRREISQMPVIGERPEFDMVWELKKELEKLRQRVATLEERAAKAE